MEQGAGQEQILQSQGKNCRIKTEIGRKQENLTVVSQRLSFVFVFLMALSKPSSNCTPVCMSCPSCTQSMKNASNSIIGISISTSKY